MNAEDEAFLVEFNDRAELTVPFTRQIEDKLMSVKPAGLTAMLDAAHVALNEMKEAKNPRKTILIISDDGDNNSQFRRQRN
jgi:Ca-activated chloride channel family protein